MRVVFSRLLDRVLRLASFHADRGMSTFPALRGLRPRRADQGIPLDACSGGRGALAIRLRVRRRADPAAVSFRSSSPPSSAWGHAWVWSSRPKPADSGRGLAWFGLGPVLWLAPVLLAGCGDLPQPFLGNPGATARILAHPPTPRLAVPAPQDALLSDQAAETFAKALADALQNQEVPAVEGPDQPGDWRLDVTASLRGATVEPVFTVVDPSGRDQGKASGTPLATADWATAAPATLSRSATQAAPGIADLLSRIQAAMQHADPHSLYNRPARVQVIEVTGAPGDGNLALTRQMRTMLSQLGPVVQETVIGADFIVRGMVRVVPVAGGQERVEIQWSVANPSGDERGRVVQLNEVAGRVAERLLGRRRHRGGAGGRGRRTRRDPAPERPRAR